MVVLNRARGHGCSDVAEDAVNKLHSSPKLQSAGPLRRQLQNVSCQCIKNLIHLS